MFRNLRQSLGAVRVLHPAATCAAGGHEAPSTFAPRSDLGNVYFLIQFTFKEITAILPREIRNFGHITPCICFSLYEVTQGILEEIIAQRIKPTQTIKGCITHVR